MKQREIKFRVWNHNKKEWTHEPGWEVNLFGECILLGGFMNGVKVLELNYCEPLQYTGVNDKNNKEIYEGDVVDYCRFVTNGVEEWHRGVVHFYNGSFWLGSENDKDATGTGKPQVGLFVNRYIEVKGNKFDNPELLVGIEPEKVVEEEECENCVECESCGEDAYDGYICHSCGMKDI